MAQDYTRMRWKTFAVILLLVNVVAFFFVQLQVHTTSLTVTTYDTTVYYQTPRQLPSGYLVNLKYGGQQASAEHALVLQQCWLGALNLTIRIVEPFLRQTVYQGYPPSKIDGPILVFSDLHDLDHYNDVSQSRGFAQVATWRDFIENGPRNAIFVNFVSSYAKYSMTCISEMNSCCSLLPKQEGMEFLFNNEFCIVKIVDLHAWTHNLSDHNLIKALFTPWKPEEVTLIFSHWIQANSAHYLPACFNVFRRPAMRDLQLPSKQLLEEAEAYHKMFLKGNVTLSVMIRVERVIEQSVEGGHAAIAKENKTTRKAYIDKCFETLFETVDLLGNKGKPFVTTDIGRFSSNSWRRLISELNYSNTEAEYVFTMTRRAVEKLVNEQFTNWENTFVNSTYNTKHWRSSAYIAVLQRTIASRSDCLLLFGGGNFQEVALSAYLRNHPNKSTQCVHIVCASRSLRRNLLEVLPL